MVAVGNTAVDAGIGGVLSTGRIVDREVLGIPFAVLAAGRLVSRSQVWKN